MIGTQKAYLMKKNLFELFALTDSGVQILWVRVLVPGCHLWHHCSHLETTSHVVKFQLPNSFTSETVIDRFYYAFGILYEKSM